MDYDFVADFVFLSIFAFVFCIGTCGRALLKGEDAVTSNFSIEAAVLSVVNVAIC